jgi:hypothetical protein
VKADKPIPVFVHASIIGYARTEQEALATYATHFESGFVVLAAQQLGVVRRESIDGWMIQVDPSG